jgi:catechol 2,3-dioxygenase-like lactoylglutathione lyase family enzyme
MLYPWRRVEENAPVTFEVAPQRGRDRLRVTASNVTEKGVEISAQVARLRAAGVTFRNEIVSGPGGSQILLQDPSGNLVELFQPAGPKTA